MIFSRQSDVETFLHAVTVINYLQYNLLFTIKDQRTDTLRTKRTRS